jgi:hypothetical protein
VDRPEDFGLLILRIYALRDGAYAYSEKPQFLNDAGGIANISSKSAGVVEKQHIKRSRENPCSRKKAFQSGPVRCCARDRFVGEDLIGQNVPAEGQSRVPALPDLVINGCGLLLIAAVPRVDRTPEAQG